MPIYFANILVKGDRMGKIDNENFKIGSGLFLFLWISSIILFLIVIIYSIICPQSIKTIYPIYILILILIGLLLLPFIGKFSVGKLFSIEMKELNSSIEKLRDTIVNIGIKNIQDVKVNISSEAPDGAKVEIKTFEKSQKYSNLAYSLFRQNRIMESIDNYKESLKYDRENWIAAMYLGFLYLSLREFNIDEKYWGINNNERLELSIYYSTSATKIDINHYNQFMNLAIAQKKLGGEGLTKLALKNMKIAYDMLEFDSDVKNHPHMFLNKGKARSFMGEFEEALGNNEKAIQYRKEAIEIFNHCPKPVPHDLETWKRQAQEALKNLENK